VAIPRGEALVLAGYPRMTSSPYWQPAAGSGDWLPPARWVEQQAPASLRALYGGDRNFDRVVVGSATKPMLAAAALEVHPRLNEQLHVRGSAASESDVFGIPLAGSWHVTPRQSWINFAQYLSLSDNRYHVRLGFLALAETAGGDVRAASPSRSTSESLNGGRGAWQHYPQFPAALGFSHAAPGRLANLAQTPLASHLERMFALNPGGKPLAARASFWTKDEADDVPPAAWQASGAASAAPDTETDDEPSAAGFAALAPAAPNLRLQGVTAPRDYVSLLLGGRTNLWANVDLASAFVTTVTGRPFAAHIVKDSRAFRFVPERMSFTETAAKLRPGLSGVVREGTFEDALGSLAPAERARALQALASLSRGHAVYAKTGTLQTGADGSGQARYTSRIVLALVRWDGPRQEAARGGLVFSLVAEMAQEGDASRWLAQFMADNQSALSTLLQNQ
ncbi:MAG TPA: hypothetical protein VIP46_07215, partial [Pyrinomonadaceae bacterium]